MTNRARLPEEEAARIARRTAERTARRRRDRRRAMASIAVLAAVGAALIAGGAWAAVNRGTPSRAAVAGVQTPIAPPLRAPGPEPESVIPTRAIEATRAAAAAEETTGTDVVPARKKPAPKGPQKKRTASALPQRFTIKIGELGYEPSVIRASAKAPITLSVAKGVGCAAGFYMPSLGVEKDNSSHSVTFSLGKLEAGTYRYTCGMGMVEGRLVVR